MQCVWENIPEDPRIGSFSSFFWPCTVFWLLWASNNCAKYQQDIPPDTLTFQLSPLLSHKDALVLSERDNLKQHRMKTEKRFNISERFKEETLLNVSNNCNNKPQGHSTSKDAKDMKINPSCRLDPSCFLFPPTAIVRRACTGLSGGYNLDHGSLYLWFI